MIHQYLESDAILLHASSLIGKWLVSSVTCFLDSEHCFFQLLQISVRFYLQQLAESSGPSFPQGSSCSSKEELIDLSY